MEIVAGLCVIGLLFCLLFYYVHRVNSFNDLVESNRLKLIQDLKDYPVLFVKYEFSAMDGKIYQFLHSFKAEPKGYNDQGNWSISYPEDQRRYFETWDIKRKNYDCFEGHILFGDKIVSWQATES